MSFKKYLFISTISKGQIDLRTCRVPSFPVILPCLLARENVSGNSSTKLQTYPGLGLGGFKSKARGVGLTSNCFQNQKSKLEETILIQKK